MCKILFRFFLILLIITLPAIAQEKNLFFVNDLCYLAKNLNFTATRQEIKIRKQIESKLNNNKSLSEKQIENLIISDKYFLSIAPVKINMEKITEYYDSISIHIQDFSIPFSDLLPYLTVQLSRDFPENVLFLQSKIDSLSKCNIEKNEKADSLNFAQMQEFDNDNADSINLAQMQKFDNDNADSLNLAQMQKFENDRIAPDFWQQKELNLNGYPDDCVAFDQNTGDCFITIADFNKSMLSYTPSKDIPIDSARYMVLDRLLNIQYLSSQAYECGFDQEVSTKSNIQHKLKTRLGISFIKKQISEQRLKKLYEEYYDELFAPKENVFFDIVASSDSLFIDSLFKLYSSSRVSSIRKTRSQRSKLKKINIPWIEIALDSLPKELIKPTDSLMEIDQCTKPFRFSEGYCFIQLKKVTTIDEIPFNKARHILTNKITYGNLGNKIQVSHSQAKAFYKNNIHKYKKPDTLHLQYWLVPFLYEDSVSKLIPDTALFKSIDIQSTGLTKHTREKLNRLIEPDDSTPFVGPVSTKFGNVYVKVLSREKAKGNIAFKVVKKEIMKELESCTFSHEEVPYSEREKSIAKDILAEEYWERLGRETPLPDTESTEAAIYSGIITVDENMDIPEELKTEHAQMLYKNYLQGKDMDAWKSSTVGIEDIFYQ